jgi:hypothetical protein
MVALDVPVDGWRRFSEALKYHEKTLFLINVTQVTKRIAKQSFDKKGQTNDTKYNPQASVVDRNKKWGDAIDSQSTKEQKHN